MAPLYPDFRWAQRKDKVFLTVKVPNVKRESAEMKVTDEGRVYFHGWGGEIGKEGEYELDIRLLHPARAEESKCGVSPRNVHFVIVKAEQGPYWPRLLHDSGRNIHCAVDWELWLDEDEADDFDFGRHFGSHDMADLDFASDSGDESGGDGEEDEDEDEDEDEEKDEDEGEEGKKRAGGTSASASAADGIDREADEDGRRGDNGGHDGADVDAPSTSGQQQPRVPTATSAEL